MAAIGVFCASSSTLAPRWLALAAELGGELGRRGHSLVSGGSCVGMMGAVTVAARAAGAHTLGVIPRSLVDIEVADRDSDELVVTDGMLGRKAEMIDRADAFVTLPGGLGTLDELFEVWTTAALGIHSKPVVLVDTDGFYAPLVSWLRGLVAQQFVRAHADTLLTVVPGVAEALDSIERAVGTPVGPP